MPWQLELAGVVFMLFFLGLIFFSECSEEAVQKKQTERILSSEGTVTEKFAKPAGYTYGFLEGDIVYRPDRYYLKVRLDNGRVIEKKIDQAGYMATNIGDRVRN